MLNKLNKVVICGSFRKSFKDICAIATEFQNLGFEITSPKISTIINPGSEFVILDSDESSDPKIIEEKHLNAIKNSDIVYFYNPQGYLGASATFELGWSLALKKLIFFKENNADFTLNLFCKNVCTPSEIKDYVYNMNHELLNTLDPNSSLFDLQKYIRDVVQQRGFDNESAQDIMLLLVEEVGELAKCIRKIVSLKIDKNKVNSYNAVQHELGDVLIYLLDLSNALGVSLFDAFYEKEQINNQRTWV
jgi:NTP pyrophosphatase (non-canonical NTP hydrolase)